MTTKHGSLRSNPFRHILSTSKLSLRCPKTLYPTLSPAQTHSDTSLQLRHHQDVSKLATRLCRPQTWQSYDLWGPTLQCLQALIPDFSRTTERAWTFQANAPAVFYTAEETTQRAPRDVEEETLAEATAEVDLRSCSQHYPQNPHILPVPQGTRETHKIFVELSSRPVTLFAYVQNTNHRTCLLSKSNFIPKTASLFHAIQGVGGLLMKQIFSIPAFPQRKTPIPHR